MSYKRKYRKGGVIKSLDDLMNQERIYVFDRINDRGWFGSWQLRYTKRMLDNGVLYYAEKAGDVTDA